MKQAFRYLFHKRTMRKALSLVLAIAMLFSAYVSQINTDGILSAHAYEDYVEFYPLQGFNVNEWNSNGTMSNGSEWSASFPSPYGSCNRSESGAWMSQYGIAGCQGTASRWHSQHDTDSVAIVASTSDGDTSQNSIQQFNITLNSGYTIRSLTCVYNMRKCMDTSAGLWVGYSSSNCTQICAVNGLDDDKGGKECGYLFSGNDTTGSSTAYVKAELPQFRDYRNEWGCIYYIRLEMIITSSNTGGTNATMSPTIPGSTTATPTCTGLFSQSSSYYDWTAACVTRSQICARTFDGYGTNYVLTSLSGGYIVYRINLINLKHASNVKLRLAGRTETGEWAGVYSSFSIKSQASSSTTTPSSFNTTIFTANAAVMTVRGSSAGTNVCFSGTIDVYGYREIDITDLCQNNGNSYLYLRVDMHSAFHTWACMTGLEISALNRHTVTLNNQSATSAGSTSTTAAYGVAMPTITVPSRTGYTFSGYYTGTNGSGTKYYNADGTSAANYAVNGSTTLYAKWTANNYTVTLNDNGGNGGSGSVTATYVASMPFATKPSRTGYTFAGYWDTSATSGGNCYYNSSCGSNQVWNKTSGATLYARWTINSYALTVTASPSSWGSVSGGGTFEYNSTHSISASANTGFHFVSWSDGGAATHNITMPASAVSRTATFARNTYTITYAGGGATGGSTVSSSHEYGVSKKLTANGYTRAYTVSYNTNGGGTAPSAQTATYTFKNWSGNGTTYADNASVTSLTSADGRTIALTAQWNPASITLPTVSRTGYTFNGWYLGSTKIGNGGASYTPSSTLTLTAGWTAKTYTISFDATGGGLVENQTATFGSAMPETCFSSRTGYTFKGFYDSISGGTQYYKADGTSARTWDKDSDTTLYAQWTALTSAISFDSEGGSSVSGTTATYDSGMPSITAPTKTGYTFAGFWDGDNGTGTQYYKADGTSYRAWNKTGAQTLYAKWTANTYYVRYNGNGNTGGNMSDSTHYYGTPKNLTVNAFEKKYTVTFNYNCTGLSNTSLTSICSFDGWATSASGNVAYANSASVNNLTSAVGGVFNIYAKWGATPAIIFPSPTRTGYTFKGWYTTSACTTLSANGGASVTPNANYTVYAKWEINSYTLTGATNNATYGSVSGGGTYNYGTAHTLTAVANNGYHFVSWDGGSTSTSISVTMPESDVTRTATFAPNTYTVAYDGNGYTSGATNFTSHTYGTASALALNGFTRAYTVTYKYQDSVTNDSTASAGWTFNKWNTAQNGSGDAYSAGANVSTLVYSGTKTLYATWNAGSVTLPNPTRTGYTFGGWYYNAGCTGTSAGAGNASLTSPAANTTLYAKWTANTYTVTYYGNGATSGSTVASNHIYDTESYISNNGFTRAYEVTYNYNYIDSVNTGDTVAYTFVRWNTASNDGGVPYAEGASGTHITSNINLYAIWNPGSVTLPTPSRTGYIFGGWYSESGCSNLVGDGGESYTPTTGVTLFAKWTPIGYTVAYNGNGSTGGKTVSSSHVYDVSKSLSANGFTREYVVTFNNNGTTLTATATYTFAGWKKNNTGAIYTNSQSVKNLTTDNGATITMFAQWTSGSVLLTTPTRTGYSFGGWYKEDTFVTQVTGSTFTPTAATTLYAKWTPISYSVVFNGNGSTAGEMSNQGYTYDSAAALTQNTYTRSYLVSFVGNDNTGGSIAGLTADYGFIGWNTVQSGSSGTAYADKATVANLCDTQDASITLYAQWSDGTVILPILTKTGYTFGGWYSDSTFASGFVGNGGATYTPSSAITLYAKWTNNTYTVAYNGNGYTGGTTASSGHNYDVDGVLTTNGYNKIYTVTYKYNDGETADSSASSVYTFNGWNTESDGSGISYADGATVKNLTTANGVTVTLYAKWGDSTATITIPTPTQAGYTFNGWYSDIGLQTKYADGGESVKLTSSPTLYAKWIANTYTVDYNGNGAFAGTMERSSHVHGSTSYLSENLFTREYTVVYNHNYSGSPDTSATAAYTFAGWNTASDGNGTAYAAGADMSALTENITLYAQWISVSVTLETPLRTGYDFGGWYNEASTLTFVGNAGATYTPSGNTQNTTAYAKWTAQTVGYLVKHKKMTLNGDYISAEIENESLTAIADSQVTPTVKAYEGFTAPDTQTVTVKPDGSTVVVYEYSRNQYDLTVTGNEFTASLMGAGTYYYGATVTVTAGLTQNACHFANWTKGVTEKSTQESYSFPMPAEDFTITANAAGHIWGSPSHTSPASFTADGLDTYTCTYNSEHQKTEVVAPTINVDIGWGSFEYAGQTVYTWNPSSRTYSQGTTVWSSSTNTVTVTNQSTVGVGTTVTASMTSDSQGMGITCSVTPSQFNLNAGNVNVQTGSSAVTLSGEPTAYSGGSIDMSSSRTVNAYTQETIGSVSASLSNPL